MSALDEARKVADAVLYEGYLLYPYTASAAKNRFRWQFGVLVPETYEARSSGERASLQTEVLIEPEPGADPSIEICVRCLHVRARSIERGEREPYEPVGVLTVDGVEHLTWDEAVEREWSTTVAASERRRDLGLSALGSQEVEILRDGAGGVRGRVLRVCQPLEGSASVSFEMAEPFVKCRVAIHNRSQVAARADRPLALRSSFISTHALLAVRGGTFVSLLDPPAAAAAAAKSCLNEGVWPVLVGRAGKLVLASPIILYDFPEVAPESEGDKFDATEIDELLNLSVLSMTDEEKREARATDAKARAIVDRAESMPPELYAKLHGALRYLETAGRSGQQVNGEPNPTLGSLQDELPGEGHVDVGGTKVARGSRVRLRPTRRADVWDSFLEGRTAKVTGIFEDFESQRYVAVSVDDDPASDLHEWYGRHLFFYPDEIEPLPGGAGEAPGEGAP